MVETSPCGSVRSRRLLLLALVLTAALGPGPAAAGIRGYSDPQAFLQALNGRAGFVHTFSELYYGFTAPDYTVSDGPYSSTYSAPDGGLYGLSRPTGFTDGLSTAVTGDALVISTEGGIEAAGGRFFLSDAFGNLVPLSTGERLTAMAENGVDSPAALTGIANDPQAFFGWISSTPLQRLTIRGGGTNPNRWVSTSLMIYGGPVTVPGPLPLAGALAAFGWGRRLRGRISQARR